RRGADDEFWVSKLNIAKGVKERRVVRQRVSDVRLRHPGLRCRELNELIVPILSLTVDGQAGLKHDGLDGLPRELKRTGSHRGPQRLRYILPALKSRKDLGPPK